MIPCYGVKGGYILPYDKCYVPYPPTERELIEQKLKLGKMHRKISCFKNETSRPLTIEELNKSRKEQQEKAEKKQNEEDRVKKELDETVNEIVEEVEMKIDYSRDYCAKEATKSVIDLMSELIIQYAIIEGLEKKLAQLHLAQLRSPSIQESCMYHEKIKVAKSKIETLKMRLDLKY